MSQWTHVAGIIRFDSCRISPQLDDEYRPDLGLTCTWPYDYEDIKKCTVPKGSEGSLHHHTWINPSENSLAAYTCMIWGDLRDYSNVNEIIDYFKRITKGKIVRQLSCEIDVEGQEVTILSYDYKKEEVVSKIMKELADDRV